MKNRTFPHVPAHFRSRESHTPFTSESGRRGNLILIPPKIQPDRAFPETWGWGRLQGRVHAPRRPRQVRRLECRTRLVPGPHPSPWLQLAGSLLARLRVRHRTSAFGAPGRGGGDREADSGLQAPRVFPAPAPGRVRTTHTGRQTLLANGASAGGVCRGRGPEEPGGGRWGLSGRSATWKSVRGGLTHCHGQQPVSLCLCLSLTKHTTLVNISARVRDTGPRGAGGLAGVGAVRGQPSPLHPCSPLPRRPARCAPSKEA